MKNIYDNYSYVWAATASRHRGPLLRLRWHRGIGGLLEFMEFLCDIKQC